MQDDNTKPSEVIYAFLVLIATAAVNLVRLICGSLWLVGSKTVNIVTGSTAEPESNAENN